MIDNPHATLREYKERLEAAPADTELILELIGLEDEPAFELSRSPRWNRRLMELEERVVARCLFEHGDELEDPDLGWMLVEHVCERFPDMQLASDLLGWVLERDPHNERALRVYLSVAFEHEYLHRGVDNDIRRELEDERVASP